VKTLIGNTLG